MNKERKTITKNDWLVALRKYLEMGWSVIPVKGKIPAISSWKEYQFTQPSLEVVQNWLNEVSFTGFAVVTGKISNLAVIDIDHGSTFDTTKLPVTLIAKSGSGSFHYYFNYPDNSELKNFAGFVTKTDIRAEGGYVVLPYSQHESGNIYQWESKNEIADFPEWLLKDLRSDREVYKVVGNSSDIFSSASEGQRNSKATQVVGKLLNSINEQKWQTVAWPIFTLWNQQNSPPLPEEELLSVFNSIAQKEKSKSQGHISDDSITSSDFITINELYNTDFSERKWLVENLIPKFGITCLAGEPKVGKSFLTLEIARAVALGTPLFGKFITQQENVLIVTKEDPEWMIQERFEKLKVSEDAPISIITHPSIFFDSSKHLDDLKEYILEKNIGFLIIDSLRRTIRGDENSSQSITPIHQNFKLLIKLGVTVLFIHHYGKDNKNTSGLFKPRGSSDIAALVDSLLGVERGGLTEGGITISQPILRQDIPQNPFIVTIPTFEDGNDAFQFAYFTQGEEKKVTKKELAGLDILNELEFDPGLTQQELITKLIDEMDSPEYKASTVKSAISELMNLKRIQNDANKKYFLSQPNVIEAVEASS